jgi:hypothetical protein
MSKMSAMFIRAIFNVKVHAEVASGIDSESPVHARSRGTSGSVGFVSISSAACRSDCSD